jgi:hypothetical protein
MQKADCRQRVQGRLCRPEDPFNAGNQAEKDTAKKKNRDQMKRVIRAMRP